MQSGSITTVAPSGDSCTARRGVRGSSRLQEARRKTDRFLATSGADRLVFIRMTTNYREQESSGIRRGT